MLAISGTLVSQRFLTPTDTIIHTLIHTCHASNQA